MIWFAHFSQSLHFGLYEDDWAFIGQPSAWDWGKFQEWIRMCVTTWPQGRPVGYALIAGTAYFGAQLGGLHFLYCFAFVSHLANALLIYAIARRQLSQAPSLCAALTYALFPSNTAIPLLTNSFFGSETVFFLLVAIWLYLKGWRIPAYLISIGSLLTYESAYLPFFAVPLLDPQPFRRLIRQLLKHSAILLAFRGFHILASRTDGRK